MINFNEIVNTVNNNFDIKLAWGDRSLGMANHIHPCSITEKEANFIKDFIVTHNLKAGYEVATAFGLSALSAGLGFKETNGKLVTMDSYIEEHYGDCGAYNEHQNEKYYDADGYKLAKWLFDYYKVPVSLEVGFSPNDTASVIKKHHGNNKLDFVFIDALHTDQALIQDTEAVLPFLADKFVVFWHDQHCHQDAAKNYIRDKFGKKWSIPFNPDARDNYGLCYVTNIA